MTLFMDLKGVVSEDPKLIFESVVKTVSVTRRNKTNILKTS